MPAMMADRRMASATQRGGEVPSTSGQSIVGGPSWGRRRQMATKARRRIALRAEQRDTATTRTKTRSNQQRAGRIRRVLGGGDEPAADVAAEVTFRTALRDTTYDSDIFAIAVPAFFALATDPIASIVDSVWIGRAAGAIPLAGSGIAVAVLGVITKLFNSPLLAVTTSVIADAYADPKKSLAGGASRAVQLGFGVGFAQAVLLIALAPFSLHLMGVDEAADPALWAAALAFLKIRALGTPALVLLLTTQGVFRGIGDTRLPLYATLGGNAANVVLDPLLILGLGMGVEGAAWATVVSEYG